MKTTILTTLARKSVKAPAPTVSAGLLAFLRCFEGVEAKVARLKRQAVNDNMQYLSAHMVEQLADIIVFMAKKKGRSANVMTAQLCIAFGVGCLARLRASQFNAALDFVLMNKSCVAA